MNRGNGTKRFLVAGLVGLLVACAGVTPTPRGEVNLLALTPVDGTVATTMRDAGFTFQTKGDPSSLDGVVIDGDYASAKDITALKATIRTFLAQKKLVLFLDTQKSVHVGGISSVLGLSSRGDHSGIAYRQIHKGRLQEFRLTFKPEDVNHTAYMNAQALRYVRSLKEKLKSGGVGDESLCASSAPDGLAHLCFSSEAIQDVGVYANGSTVPKIIGTQYSDGFDNTTYFDNKNYLLSSMNPSTVAVDVYYDNRPAAVGGSWFYLQSQVAFSGYGVVDAQATGARGEPALSTTQGSVAQSHPCSWPIEGTTDVEFYGPFFMGMGYKANLQNADGSALNPGTYALTQVVPSNVNNVETDVESITASIGFSVGTTGGVSKSHQTSTTVTNKLSNWRTLNRTGVSTLNILYLSQNPLPSPPGMDKVNSAGAYGYDPDLEQFLDGSRFADGQRPLNAFNQTGTNVAFSSAAMWRIRANQDQVVIGPHLALSPSVWFKYETRTRFAEAYCEDSISSRGNGFTVNPGYFSDLDVDLNQVIEQNLPVAFPAGTSYQMGASGSLSINGSVNIGARQDIPAITVSDPSGSGAKYTVTQPTSCTPNGDCAFQVNVAWSPPAGTTTTATVQAKGLGFTNQTTLSIAAYGSR
jgi:hypothetical protein